MFNIVLPAAHPGQSVLVPKLYGGNETESSLPGAECIPIICYRL